MSKKVQFNVAEITPQWQISVGLEDFVLPQIFSPLVIDLDT